MNKYIITFVDETTIEIEADNLLFLTAILYGGVKINDGVYFPDSITNIEVI